MVAYRGSLHLQEVVLHVLLGVSAAIVLIVSVAMWGTTYLLRLCVLLVREIVQLVLQHLIVRVATLGITMILLFHPINVSVAPILILYAWPATVHLASHVQMGTFLT